MSTGLEIIIGFWTGTFGFLAIVMMSRLGRIADALDNILDALDEIVREMRNK